jgi:hypothetical protein
VAEFWFLADWLLYSPNLNLLDFSTGSILQPEGQATPHSNLAALRPSVTTPVSGDIDLQNMLIFPPPPLSRR